MYIIHRTMPLWEHGVPIRLRVMLIVELEEYYLYPVLVQFYLLVMLVWEIFVMAIQAEIPAYHAVELIAMVQRIVVTPIEGVKDNTQWEANIHIKSGLMML